MGLTDTTTPSKSGSGSNGNEGVLHIPLSSRIETSPSDGFVIYQGYLCVCGGSKLFAEVQSTYFTTPADKVTY